MSVPLPGETLEYIKPTNQFIFDSVGNLIGIQNPRGNGADLRTIDSMTWANRPTSMVDNAPILFTDIGASGTLMRYANSRWRPLAGQAQLAQLSAPVSGITNAGQIVSQTLLPAGSVKAGDIIRIYSASSKSGGTDTSLMTVYLGTAGTTSDAAVMPSYIIIAAALLSHGGIYDILIVSNTSAQRIGTGPVAAGGASGFGGQTSAAISGVVAIPDISTNAVYVSVHHASGGTTNTVAVQEATIQLITP